MWPIVIVIGLLVAAVIALIIWEPFARDLDQAHFPNSIRTLLTRTENGGFCRFDHRGSEVWFSIERQDGSGQSAVLALRIPRQDRTLALEGEFRREFESQGYDFVLQKDNPSLLAKVMIPVADIWSNSSGATGAHAARIFLQVIGLGRDARFNIEEGGNRHDWSQDV